MHERTDRQFAYTIMAQRHNVPSRATLTGVPIGTARHRSSLYQSRHARLRGQRDAEGPTWVRFSPVGPAGARAGPAPGVLSLVAEVVVGVLAVAVRAGRGGDAVGQAEC